jgi:hypothetical protein
MSDIRFMPGDLTPGPAAGDQTSPAIARGGDIVLAVWVDATSSATSLSGAQSDLDVVGVRLDAEGRLIDPTPFVISRAPGYQRDPSVTWNGANWLVAWENQSPTQFYYQTEILAVRVSPQGGVLDPVPIKPFGADAADEAVVTSNGGDWLVVTQNYAAGQGGLRARRIAADGSLPDAAPALLVAQTYYLYFGLDVDSAGGEYLLTYQDQSTFKGRRFSAGLTPIGAAFNLPSLRRVASNGAGYYLVLNAGNLIQGRPMTVEGVQMAPVVTLGNGSQSAWFETDLTWDGSMWWVSHKDAWQGLMFQRITAAGALLDPAGIAIDPANDDSNAAHRISGRPAGGVTCLWQDLRVGGTRPYDIYAASVIDPSDHEPGTPISLSAPMQIQPDIATGPPGQYLMVYASRRSGDARVLAARIDAQGNPLDGEPILVADGPSDASPAAAWNGELYMIAWNDGGVVVTRRMDSAGVLVDPAPVTVMNGGDPDVSALGPDFLVVATDIFNFPHYRATYARRMSGATGQPIDAQRFIVSFGNYAQLARVTTLAGRWLVTWQDNFSHDDPQAAIYARLVNPDATLSPQLTVLFASGGTPDVAVSGSVATFVWRHLSLSNANNYVSARRMSADGTFLDASPFVVAEAPGRQLNPVVAWDGARFAAAWEDQRNQVSFFDARTGIFGARLAAEGPPLIDPAAYGVFESEAPLVSPALASLGGGRTLSAAAELDPAPGLGTYRLRWRVATTSLTADVTGDGVVDVNDLVAVILAWGVCDGACPADVDGDGLVGVTDLVTVVLNWS